MNMITKAYQELIVAGSVPATRATPWLVGVSARLLCPGDRVALCDLGRSSRYGVAVVADLYPNRDRVLVTTRDHGSFAVRGSQLMVVVRRPTALDVLLLQSAAWLDAMRMLHDKPSADADS